MLIECLPERLARSIACLPPLTATESVQDTWIALTGSSLASCFCRTIAVHSTTSRCAVILERHQVESVLDVVKGWLFSIGIARYGTRAGMEFTN